MMELSPVIPVEQITRPLDRFFCEPWKSTLSAASCTARQRMAREQGPTSRFDKCFDCPIGRQIAKQLDAPPPEQMVTPCAEEGCQRGATDGRFCQWHASARRRAYGPDPPRRKEPTTMPPKPSETSDVNFVTCTELARLGKVSTGAISQNKSLQEARDGRLYDIRHPSVVAWLERRGAGKRGSPAPAKAAAKPARKKRVLAKRAVSRPVKNGATSVAQLYELQRIVEAVELVETIGWELARTLARGIRASA